MTTVQGYDWEIAHADTFRELQLILAHAQGDPQVSRYGWSRLVKAADHRASVLEQRKAAQGPPRA